MNRARPRLDLLPLLDVFMVVLFVFATIQEKQLDETQRDVEAERARAAELETELDDAVARARARTETEAKAERDAELEEIREKLEAREAEIRSLRSEAERVLADRGAGEDAIRRTDVLSKLLDRYTVFEVEIAGQIGPDGTVTNMCCFRDDPMADEWQRCGAVPAPSAARAQWLDDGGGGLVAALRQTKGGNAMTILRQDEHATYRIAAGLEALLRERFGEHQIYDEGVGLVELRCGAPP